MKRLTLIVTACALLSGVLVLWQSLPGGGARPRHAESHALPAAPRHRLLSAAQRAAATIDGPATDGTPPAATATPLPSAPIGRLAAPEARRKEVQRRQRQHLDQKSEALRRAQEEQWTVDADGTKTIRELMAIRDGRVLVYQTENANAAISTAADLVRNQPPYNLNGSNILVGIWDGGHVRDSHREFGGRVTRKDVGSVQYHATHVFGTIGAEGVTPTAMGMAPSVQGESYEWNSDLAEMTQRAMAAPHETGALQLSNHSYGHISGWDFNSWPVRWYGTWGHGYRKSDFFGSYSQETAEWDALCHDAPYFLPVKSAGNDRTDGAPGNGQTFEYYDGGWISKPYDPAVDPLADNADQGGYDTIPDIGNAKNILTVGAVGDAVSGGERSVSHAAMEPYSGWGPADDGRVKPDIVANGSSLYSTSSSSDSDYTRLSGTSMSTPNVTGSAVLLADAHRRLFSGLPMPAATLKGLILHTADDLGTAGPDYRTGWGLMNTHAAMRHLELHHRYADSGHLREGTLDATNQVDVFAFQWDGVNPLKMTLSWTDPPGTPRSGLDDRTPALVNDLDMRLIGPNGETNFPFVLDVSNPAAQATRGDNAIDNVEQILVPAPAAHAAYTLRISYKASLASGRQHYSLLASGIGTPPEIEHDPLPNSSSTNQPYLVEARITSLDALNTNTLRAYWTTNLPPVDFDSRPLTHVSNDLYRATLPAQAMGATVSYYLFAETTNQIQATHPPGAPATSHQFRIAPPVSLMVFGTPDPHGPVTPDYGQHLFASGITVRAVAAATEPAEPGHRFACEGWTGFGDVPAEGPSNQVAFTIGRDSLLIWRWISQYRLNQTSSVDGFIDTTTWWADTTNGQTVYAPAITNLGATRYRFTEWRIDGARWPDATGVTVNPAGGFPMSSARTATAVYLPADQDLDQDGLPDWWERYYFGNLAQGPDDDPDGDGYLNLEEYEDRSNPVDPASTPRGPVIVHHPLPHPLSHPAPWGVTAHVTDNHAVRDVILRWRRNELSWRQVAMTETGEEAVYTAAIPAPGTLGDRIEYRIEATDVAGYVVADGPHATFVAYPLSTIAPDKVNVRMGTATETNAVFTLANSGNTDLVWQASIHDVGIEEDVESGTNAWEHSGPNDLWHISPRRAVSGSNAWYCGDPALGQYTDSMNASLVSPSVLVGEDARLHFMQWCKTELDSGEYTWDGAVVEISTDEGQTYEFITPEGGYPYRIVDNPASPFAPDTPCLGGTGGWEKVAFDLSSYAGQNVRIRFRFGSDGYVVDEGWFIDDIRLTPTTGTNHWLSLPVSSGIVRAAESTNAILHIDTAGLPYGYNDAVMLRVDDNDPLDSTASVLVSLRVRSRPRVDLTFAGQTPPDGSGRVTISNLLSDADGEICALEVLFSTDAGQTWTPSWIGSATAGTGSAVPHTENVPQVTNLATTDGTGSITNAVTLTWETTQGAHPIVLAPQTLVRCRAWDGAWWSDPVTSSTFFVDNEAPAPPSELAVSSHAPAIWTTNPVFVANWDAATDGDGIGIGGYLLALATNELAAPTVVATSTTASATLASPVDGADLRLRLQAFDHYGNRSASLQQGPFRVDTTPPSPQGAVIDIETSAQGAYTLATDLEVAWRDFAESGSGIAHYYLSFTDGGGTTNGIPTTAPWATLRGAAPDHTNVVYVWACDNVGLIGPAAQASVLVLSPDADWDGDGLSNADEGISGTDATDAANVLRVSERIIPTVAPDVYEHFVTWYGVTNRRYTVFETTNLVEGPWQPMTPYTGIPGSNAAITVRGNLNVTGYRFYRISVTRE